MIKNFLLTALFLMCCIGFSQVNTMSPYSAFGIGELKFSGTLESRSMAGISAAIDSTRVNFQNPASYGNLRYTNFLAGASATFSDQKSSTKSVFNKSYSVDYLSLSVPVGKFGAGFGLMPYSSVGFYTKSITSTNNGQRESYLNGWGGINSVFIGTGYQILSNLSIGASASYNFGKIQRSNADFIADLPTGSRELNTSQLSGISFNIGLLYQQKLKEKLSLSSSIYYSPESNLSSNNEQTLSQVIKTTDFEYSTVKAETPVSTSYDLKTPGKLAVGVGLGNQKKWLVAVEATFKGAGYFGTNYNSKVNVSYEKSATYSIGGFFIPNFTTYSNYFRRITYRGGLVYEQTGLVINSKSINSTAVTFGAGLPIKGMLSNVNIGVLYGKKGTTANQLVQENYTMVNIGFSLNDRWFVKNKYR